MSNTIDTYLNNSLDSSQQEPLTILEQVVNLVQELKDTKDEQHQVNTELDQEIQTHLEAEPEVSQLCQQVQLVEVNLDNTTNHVNHLTTQLTDTTKVSEIEQLIDTNLENNLTPVEDKEINLDNQLRKVKEYNIQTDKRFHDNINRLTELQERFENAERRSAIAQKRISSLEEDIRNAYVEMKILIQARERSRTREEKYLKDIEDLQNRLKTAQERTDNAEADAEKSQLKIAQLQEKLLAERNKSSRIEKMIANSSKPLE
ncbi:unnamed protein product [Rotaria sordida]|uniref:Uncharacterized protein n=1 Tax=Rotaria sordida TaxID=392033 RepID=A0A814Q5Q9_9BILA|nr:unnamed protein product [Rotaria sordida]CAF4134811.1 unnamed protein product [Rotaria sordida]